MTDEWLLERILRHEKSHPDKIALKFLEGNYTTSQELTYRQLKERVIALANDISNFSAQKQRKNEQEPILLLFDSSLDYIVSFLAVLYSGNIAVTAYPPRQTRHLERLLKIVEDSQVEIILTTSKVRNYCEVNDFKFPRQVNLVCVDELEIKNTSNLILTPAHSSIAFLQYTSGSTGSPKGVVVTQKNIVFNLELLIEYMGVDSINTCVSWLPIFHDMGLIGNTLLPLYSGATCVFMAPLTFLKRPLFWLKKISEEKGTYTMAPNFSYELAIAAFEKQEKSTQEFDFSHVHYLINGAEPVKTETIRRVEKVLKPYGLPPGAMKNGYGMAEATLVISIHKCPETRFLKVDKDKLALGEAVEPEQGSATVELVRNGKISDKYLFRIVDPQTQDVVANGRIGELWLQGASVAAGYYRNSEKTNEIFNAFTTNGEGQFLRTGDLAFVDSENYLVVCGRVKDLMIINGRNIYPQDVERACCNADDAVINDGTAAFSIPGKTSEECVIVAEVRHHLEPAKYEEILAKIKKSVFDATDIIPDDIWLIQPKRLLKTSSGKVQRNACKQAYLNEEFVTVARLKQPINEVSEDNKMDEAVQNEKEIVMWFKQWIAANTQIDYNSIDEQRAFSEYGLNSVKLVTMISELEQFTHQHLDPWIAWEFPNIHALSQKITNHFAVTKDSQEQTYEAIAIVGMDCRIPGSNQQNIIGVDDFWKFLQTEDESIRPIPQDRWDIREYYDPDPNKKGMMYSSEGSFLTDIKRFDAKFFNISPREVQYLDPQQRLSLMVTWNALEDAGIVPETLKNSKTGVYLGISSHDYDALIQKQVPLEELSTYQATGTSFSTAAGRIAYFLGTQGPCMAIDTACSSSLVSIHQASRALQDRDCNLAIAGGVNLILSPEGNIIFCKSGMLSPKNRCSTFDAEADGYVRGEGCGIVILKRLTDALRDNNKIYAVIHSSVINQDGASNGLTAPNLAAQIAVMESAINLAQLDPEQITHVEAHGTGTPLGDPIEWEGIRRVYAANRKNPLYITSVKTRIGHLEAAAGVASFIKTVLAIKYGQIPSHLHLKQFNPKISQQDTMKVPTQTTIWEDTPRYAGVSSFGFSGTNAHIILGRFQEQADKVEEKSLPHYLWVISARNEDTLKSYLDNYRNYSKTMTHSNFAVISYQSLTQRTHFPHRAFIVAKNSQEWAQALEDGDWQQGKMTENNELAWLFTGQGCLEPDLAAPLYKTLPVFAAVMDQCCAITEPLLDYNLREILLNTPDDIDINYTLYAQPALFVYEYALAKWFLSLGLRPVALLGHSLGEYVAACIAEIMSLEDALQLVCLRAKLIASLPNDGAMLAIAADEVTVKELLVNFPELVVSVKNSPQQTVVSGVKESINALQNYCKQHTLRCKKIATSHAFHSSLMNPIVDEFYQQAQKINYKPAKIPLISNVTGVELCDGQMDANYWCEHLTKTVEFHSDLQTLVARNITLFQEIGPKAILSAQAQEVHDFIALPSVKNPKKPWAALLESLGELHVRGVDINWHALGIVSSPIEHTLPKYPFLGKEYWLPEISDNSRVNTSWKKNLYGLRWCKLNWRPVENDCSNEKISIIRRKKSSPDQLISLLKNHYGQVESIHINSLTEAEIVLPKIADASRLVYLCDASDDEIETEFSFMRVLTTLLLENFPEKPFVFLNNLNATSKMGSALLAMLKSIKQEHPVWSAQYLEGDLFNDDPQWIHSIDDSKNGHWALRYEGQEYFRRQITPLEPGLLTGSRKVYPENTYLVTGACGDIGQLLIETLLELGVKTIVAIGRRANNLHWSTTIQGYLEKGEAQIHYRRCDVSEAEEVTQLIADITQNLLPLGAVIHTAGITIDKPWLETSDEEIHAIIAGKALGALNLHLATASCSLKEFICISSISGIFGNQGQAAYAAANAFLDDLGEQRRKQGLPSFNLILGPVKHTGLFKKNEQELTKYLALQGIEPIEPVDLKSVLKEQEKEHQIVMAKFNRLMDSTENSNTFGAAANLNEKPLENNKITHRDNCSATEILKIVQKILGLATNELSVTDNWFESGMDSIMAAQVVHKINRLYQENVISSKDVFNYFTAENLAQKIRSAPCTEKVIKIETVQALTIPLSLQQQEIWNFLKTCSDHRAYQIPMILAIKGPLSVEKLQKSVSKISKRHDIFHFGFHEILGQVNLHIHSDSEVKLEFSQTYDEKDASDFLTETFDVSKPPLLRTKLIQIAKDEYQWLLVFHHLISDGNTVSAFIHEVIADYEDKLLEAEVKQYSQYISWQWNTIYYQLDTNLQDYWSNRLQGVPLDVPVPEPTNQVEVISREIPINALKHALDIIEKNRFSLSNYLLANLFEMLFEQFKRDEQGIVVFFSGRESGDFTSVFGDTSNDVVITARKEDNILKQTKALQEQLFSLVDKQHLRMGMLKEMGLQAPMISFDFQRSSDLDLVKTNLNVTTIKSGHVQNYLWGDEPRILSFKVLLTANEIKLSLKYRLDKITRNYADELLNHWFVTITERHADLNAKLVKSMDNFHEQEASILQQNLVQLFKGHPDGMPYFIPLFKEVDAEVNVERLNTAMFACIRKNPALRSYFIDEPQQLKLVLARNAMAMPVQIIKTEELYKTIGELLTAPIALDKPPLLRWYLIYHPQKAPILLIRLHHMIVDGVSAELFSQDFANFYANPDLEIAQSQDDEYLRFYAAVQDNYQEYLTDYKDYLLTLNQNYSMDNATQNKKSYSGGLIYRKLAINSSVKIDAFCHKNKISKYVFYLYIYCQVISKVLNKESIYISVVKSNRGELPHLDMLGYYADNIPLLIPTKSPLNFIMQLQKIQMTILEVIQRFQYPVLTSDLNRVGYIQPEFIFNQYTLSPEKEPFRTADYIIENIVNQQKQVALWNYHNPEKLNFMVRSSEQGDLLALIFNQSLMTLEEVDYLLNQIIEEVIDRTCSSKILELKK